MKKIIFLVGFMLLIVFTLGLDEDIINEGEISVELVDGTLELRQMEEFLTDADYTFPYNDEELMNKAIEHAMLNDNIVSAEKVKKVEMVGIPDYIPTSQEWRYTYTNIDKIWDDLSSIPYLEGQLNPIIVAVIDTGINVDHEDINIILDKGIDVAEEDDDPTDYNSHGTHVAGIVGAKKTDSGDGVVGVAPGVKILPIKVYKDDGSTSSYYIAKGIHYAIEHNVDVITMSLTYNERSSQVAEALIKAEAEGIVVISATDNKSNHWIDGETYHQRYSGEGRRSIVMNYPAAEETVIAVGSVMKNPLNDELGISDFSDVGGVVNDIRREVDVVAPGSYISSSDYNNSDSARMKSGTSVATPHVAGYVVLLMAKYPQLTPSQIREVIRTTAYDPGIVIPDGYDRKDTIGYGLIDVQAGLNFSPILKMGMNGLSGFVYDPMSYNETFNVSNDVNYITINPELMFGTVLKINGEITNAKVINLNIGSNVVEVEVNLNNVIRKYTYTIIRESFTDPMIRNLIVSGPLAKALTKVNDEEFEAVVENNVNQIDVKFELLDSNSILSVDCSDYIYQSGDTISIILDDATSIIVFKVQTSDGAEKSYILRVPHRKDVKDENTLPITPVVEESVEVVLPSEVKIHLDQNFVAVLYGLSADELSKSYLFLATVTGTNKKDVIWSISDERYATVDKNGRVTSKDDVPNGTGSITVTVTATTVVGGVSASATVIFIEKTPLGNENFSAPYISGYSDGTFKPKKNLSRAEVATIFSKILNLDISSPGSQIFEDVNVDYWGYPYIQSMFQTKIFIGYFNGGNRFFNPDAPISRAEIAQVITNYWAYRKVEVDGTRNHDIPDVPSNHWAAIPINRLYNTEIFTGYLNSAYRPNDDILREQTVNMINKLIGRPDLPSEEPKFSDVPKDYSYYGDIEAASSFYYKKIEE
ncbi:MAG: S8 family serine peptidase [Clostridiales bacterium]|nr:S8 family serine peptidase [Clostridiales bacterium]